ncbi:hypothetical protein FIBSPDRAFT_801981 [Athelia psychrophila]|uniref:Bromodomain associated domain-containing protein n=1 Tax=Athelia psychrophila TaxID=1759441 RepID=A0A165YJD1_9AGAM|nr:hypothetical protein FIBSPDRAFT_801981 [Fibularhizoctonia sp. CBS 109695]
MDAKAKVALESAVHRTLHAHAFSRSSSQASLVLTDLLSRYLTLLASTCAKYAQHAGRTDLTPQDALCALNEMGVNMEEVDEYRSTEAVELARYAANTARRVEELKDFTSHLSEGLERERDAIPLVYAPWTDDLALEEDDSEDDEDGEEQLDVTPEELEQQPIPNGIHTTMKDIQPRTSTPPLPLSPISNVSSPPRKRKRADSYTASYIPHFLPPYPSDTAAIDRPPSPRSPHPLAPSQLPPIKVERPTSPLPQLSTPTYASDYFTSVPYSHSSLSATPEGHLPSFRPPRQSQSNLPRQPTLQTQPTLFAAYHHILTRPVPPPSSTANGSRHKVAMALLALTQNSPRWEPPNTLYSSSAPSAPRVSVIGPTFPTLISDVPSGLGDLKAVDADRERKANLLPLPPRAVFSNERITPLISQQSSRIPELARHVLPGSVHSRTTRLAHPPPLFRGSQRLLYGPGVNAPWNANTGPTTVAATPLTAKVKDNTTSNGILNAAPRPIPDARLHTTWDAETKRYNEALPIGRKGRMSSMSGLTLSLGGRVQNESKAV